MCQRCPLQWVESAGKGMIQDHNLTNFMAHTHVWEEFKKVYLTCHIGNEFNSGHCQISTDVANEGFWKEMQILGMIVTFAEQ